MAHYLLMVQVDCSDTSREEEFNQWYDKIHLPDMLQVPGLVKAVRYLNLNPETNKRPKYVILYEIDTDDINSFKNIFNDQEVKAQNAGRMIDFLSPETHYPFQPPYYKQIICKEKSKY